MVHYKIVQYSTVQYSIAQHSIVWYSIIQYSIVQYSIVQYSIVQYSTVQYSIIVQYIIVKYNIIWYSTSKSQELHHNTLHHTIFKKETAELSNTDHMCIKYIMWGYPAIICFRVPLGGPPVLFDFFPFGFQRKPVSWKTDFPRKTSYIWRHVCMYVWCVCVLEAGAAHFGSIFLKEISALN